MASLGQIKKFLKYDQSVTSNVREPTQLDGLRSLLHLIGRFMEFPTERRQLPLLPPDTRYEALAYQLRHLALLSRGSSVM